MKLLLVTWLVMSVILAILTINHDLKKGGKK